MHSINLFKTLLQLIRRDFYVFGQRLTSYGINYLIIFPVLSIVTFGYIQPGIYFGPHHTKNSIILLIGMFTINMLSLCFTLLVPFIYDLESDRFIDYQILLLPPRLLLLEMILFPALLANLIAIPFFPLARILIPHYFVGITPAWGRLFILILCTSLVFASYIMMALCLMKKSSHIRQFWLRFNWPLMVLGGFWIPWHLLHKNFSFFSIIALIDPFTYITEGLRSALLGPEQFISYPLCIIALLTFFCIFTTTAVYFFKRKLDHI
jgi:ABC-type multidrug transport system permease subunit